MKRSLLIAFCVIIQCYSALTYAEEAQNSDSVEADLQKNGAQTELENVKEIPVNAHGSTNDVPTNTIVLPIKNGQKLGDFKTFETAENLVIDNNIPLPEWDAFDKPNDSGGNVILKFAWKKDGKSLSVDELKTLKSSTIKAEILRAFAKGVETPKDHDYKFVDSISFEPKTELLDFIGKRQAFYKLRITRKNTFKESEVKGAIFAPASWFNKGRTNLLIAAIIMVLLIIGFIRLASKGRNLFIRRIHGLDAIDEAVGRATEMGRNVLFIPGIMEVDDPQTIAGLTILGHVSRYTADYGTDLDVPVSRSMVMVAAREIVKEGYLASGAPEGYRDEMVHYITDDQFGFAAAVDGIMVREKPAAIFYQGSFYAESLILAETGHSVEAIQIAGTAMVTQLPFFITACDYTLIGEELFAASAYLSKEPKQLGSLKGQDYGKLISIVVLVVCIGIATLGEVLGYSEWTEIVKSLIEVVD